MVLEKTLESPLDGKEIQSIPPKGSDAGMVSPGVKQKTAYEMPMCDWSSDVCSSDLFFLWSCMDVSVGL